MTQQTIVGAWNGYRWRVWRWDGAHPREINIEAISKDDVIIGHDSRGYYIEGDPDVTLTLKTEPGGQCTGCPRCQ